MKAPSNPSFVIVSQGSILFTKLFKITHIPHLMYNGYKMRKFIIYLVSLCIFNSCSSSEVITVPKSSMNKKIILFVPGFYGSTLVEKNTSKIRWATLSNFLFSQQGIATTVPGTGIVEDGELIPGEVLKSVKVIPFIKIDSYGKTLDSLNTFAEENQMTLETVAFDWRDDFISSLKIIDKKIKDFQLNADDELIVVSHSTGALLMSYYLRYGAQDLDHAVENWEGLKYIKKAVMAAAPFRGLMVLLRDTEHGVSKGLNRELLSARDYSSFKSSYMFLPPHGEDIGFRLEDRLKIVLNLHSVETWEKNNWGLFKFTVNDSQKEAARKFTETYMKRSQRFHDLLRAPVIHRPAQKIPLLYTWGIGHKTLQNGFVSTDKKNPKYKTVDFTLKGKNVDGDGTVTKDSGRPLDYFKVLSLILHPTKLSHLDVISDESNQKFIQEFITNK
jgi:hypothetical protein